MNYRMVIFWGGILILDYFLLMGLPSHPAQKIGLQQARVEPVHCWQAVYDCRQYLVAGDVNTSDEDCRLGPVSVPSLEKVSVGPDTGASGQRAGGRVKVNLSVRPVI